MDSMTSKGKKWRIACIVAAATLTAAIIVMAVFLGIFTKKNNGFGNDLENSYQQAYYTMMDNLWETEFAMKKLSASNTPAMQEKFLKDCAKYSASALTAFNQLAVENTSTNNVIKTLNQISEYTDVMARSIAEGNSLSVAEKADVASMLANLGKINIAFGGLQDKLVEGYRFSDEKNTAWNDLLADLNTQAEEFPIYVFDGNSCLLIGDQEPLGLVGDAVTQEQASTVLSQRFRDRNIADIKLVSQNDRKMAIYYFEFKLGDIEASAEVTKKGGHLLNFTIMREVDDPQLEESDAIAVAQQYVENMGFESMVLYSVSNSNSTYYIDMVYEQQGVLMIADKVRLKIAADNGEITGFSANCYFNFHHQRQEELPVVTEELVREKVSGDLVILENGISLVNYPIGKTEKLAYEVRGTFDGDEFYVYIDANTGNELDILRVIDSNGERLLR